jgi:hypothetical protein
MYCGFVGRFIRSLATAFRSSIDAGGPPVEPSIAEERIAHFNQGLCVLDLGAQAFCLVAGDNGEAFICGCKNVLRSDETELGCSPEFRYLSHCATVSLCRTLRRLGVYY